MERYPINPLQDKIQHFPLFIRNFLNLFPFGGYNIISTTILLPTSHHSTNVFMLHHSQSLQIHYLFKIFIFQNQNQKNFYLFYNQENCL
jgi:hypothetical protein